MRKNIKYFIAGFLAASFIAAIPAAADFIDAFMNTSRISVDGIDRLVWGEEMELENGWFAPSSINYKDTLYLPMRKISELLGKDVFWNEDSHTAYIVDDLTDRKVIAEREDAEGNLWEYATARSLDGHTYLTATDGYRGYTRVYHTASINVEVRDDAIYFMKLKEHNVNQNQGTLIRLPFESDSETQDGEAIVSLYPMNIGDVFFDGDYVFYAGRTPGNGTHGTIAAFNFIKMKEIRFNGEEWSNIRDLKMTSSDDERTDMEYTYVLNGEERRMKIGFFKEVEVFGRTSQAVNDVPEPSQEPVSSPEPTSEPSSSPAPTSKAK